MQLLEDIKIITLFALAFFSVFLFSYKKGNINSNYLLASIYGFQALETLNGTFYRFPEFWMNEAPWVFYSTEFSFFLCGPAIYYFFRYSLDFTFQFKKQHLWHLLPAVLHTIFLIFKFHIYSNAIKTALLYNGVMSPEEDFVIHFCRNASVLIYLGMSTWHIVKSKVNYGERNSWLLFFLIVFYIVEIIQILQFVDLETRIYNTIIYNTTSILWFIVAITTLYKALKNPFFFSYESTEVKNFEIENERENQLTDHAEFDEILAQLKKTVLEGTLFLEPELTLQKIASEINVSTKKTSYVINEHFGMNVSDFINSHKIEKAKILLTSTKNKELNILEIGFLVGFNSKATFNRAFIKFVGISPTEYRKNSN